MHTDFWGSKVLFTNFTFNVKLGSDYRSFKILTDFEIGLYHTQKSFFKFLDVFLSNLKQHTTRFEGYY